MLNVPQVCRAIASRIRRTTDDGDQNLRLHLAALLDAAADVQPSEHELEDPNELDSIVAEEAAQDAAEELATAATPRPPAEDARDELEQAPTPADPTSSRDEQLGRGPQSEEGKEQPTGGASDDGATSPTEDGDPTPASSRDEQLGR